LARREAARRERRRKRRQMARTAAVLAVVAVAIAVVDRSGGSSHSRGGAAHAPASSAEGAVVVGGGPLAPKSLGGVAALWTPKNVVGMQPGTAAAYEAASKRKGLPGYLMIADRGNNRILVVDPQHNVIFRYPAKGDRGHLYYDDDTFVEPGGAGIISNEEDDHAIVQLRLADRKLTVLFGHPGQPGSDGAHVNTPDDAYMLPDGSFTVADAYNCRILFIRGGRIVREYGHSGVCRHDPPRYFGSVNGDTPVPGGGVMASEIAGNWIDEIGPEGRLRWSVQAPVGYPSDPQPLPGGRVLLADYSSPGHILIIDRRGRVLWRYGPSEGHGRLDHPSLAMALPNGDVAVNDDFRQRVLVIDPRTNAIVWQYGHSDHPGTGQGYLNTPGWNGFRAGGAEWGARLRRRGAPLSASAPERVTRRLEARRRRMRRRRMAAGGALAAVVAAVALLAAGGGGGEPCEFAARSADGQRREARAGGGRGAGERGAERSAAGRCAGRGSGSGGRERGAADRRAEWGRRIRGGCGEGGRRPG